MSNNNDNNECKHSFSLPQRLEFYRIPHETVGDAEAPHVELALVIPFLEFFGKRQGDWRGR